MKRDINIIKAFNRELNLFPRVKQSKKKYTRKAKHKNSK